jgi:hypothetical protein
MTSPDCEQLTGEESYPCHDKPWLWAADRRGILSMSWQALIVSSWQERNLIHVMTSPDCEWLTGEESYPCHDKPWLWVADRRGILSMSWQALIVSSWQERNRIHVMTSPDCERLTGDADTPYKHVITPLVYLGSVFLHSEFCISYKAVMRLITACCRHLFIL